MKINTERLAKTFTTLCETDSPSRQEKNLSLLLQDIFNNLGCRTIREDNSARITGSDCGNLIIDFIGDTEKQPVFFNCHMDTVEPGSNIKVLYKDGIFSSDGTTILGSDDKSGIACFIEAMRTIKEQNLAACPVEFILTTCEEIGLLGAKALNPELIKAKIGYALDSTGIGKVIIGAPAANRLKITVRGVAAHAGLHPEWGVNAITLASKALSQIMTGRVDTESSINFGTINGGTASNIVADQVTIIGEVRSHSTATLELLTQNIKTVFRETIESWQNHSGEAKGKPSLIFEIQPDFPVMNLKKSDPVIKRIAATAESIGMNLEFIIAGGGSDANIFNGYGLQTAIIATGMTHVHSLKESVSMKDMVSLTELIIALITNNSK
jgi:tripeptide aminopeptidase